MKFNWNEFWFLIRLLLWNDCKDASLEDNHTRHIKLRILYNAIQINMYHGKLSNSPLMSIYVMYFDLSSSDRKSEEWARKNDRFHGKGRRAGVIEKSHRWDRKRRHEARECSYVTAESGKVNVESGKPIPGWSGKGVVQTKKTRPRTGKEATCPEKSFWTGSCNAKEKLKNKKVTGQWSQKD